MSWTAPYDLIGGCVVAFGVAAAYLSAVLPRFAARRAVALTGAVAAALMVAATTVPARVAPILLLGASVLVAGHLGWIFGRRFNLASKGLPRPQPLQGTQQTADSAPAPRRAPAPAALPTLPLAADRTTLGRYRIDRPIGRGSMGVVYLGHDPQIDRQVAIKTMALSREFEGHDLVDARARFFREAETAGRLQHPDIVTIFDVGEEQDLAYIAMEYLKGHDLLAHTQPARLLPVLVVLRTLERVALALAYAHSQGVVHRDIKPANVMVDMASDSVKVTDFGIASIADGYRTRTGLVLGTPSFMSPQQLSGQRVDGRADLYSLGVMLFQLLTGALPHRSESMATLMHQIAHEAAPDVRSLRPELPESLANVVALALEKRPELRYGDGRQMAADLHAVALQISSEPAGLAGSDAGTADFSVAPSAPGSSNFEETVKFLHDDSRHNS